MIPAEPTQAAQSAGQVEAGADWLYAAVMGIVEGLTEFLPISSTGHLIVTSRVFGRLENSGFEIGIQMGAITAILFLYWSKVFGAARALLGTAADTAAADTGTPRPRTNLLWLLVVAAAPAAVVGLLFKKRIVELLFHPLTVAWALVLGGVALLGLEAWQRRRDPDDGARPLEAMTSWQALQIGLFQTLALIPGTSRSGAVIAGAMVVGFQRTACAEFSFLVGLPVLYGAALVKLADHTELFADPVMRTEFLVASAAAFVSAALVVRPFVRFLQRHTFVPFAWYRILAGCGLLLLVQQGCV